MCGLDVAAAWPLAARAQQDNRVRRVGVLIGARNESDPITKARIAALQEGLVKFGWAENRNLHLDVRLIRMLIVGYCYGIRYGRRRWRPLSEEHLPPLVTKLGDWV